jgi:subtilisin family serine protease
LQLAGCTRILATVRAAQTQALRLVKLDALIGRTSGSAGVRVGLVDGPVATGHPDLAGARITAVEDGAGAACMRVGSDACEHGTFVAGILVSRRGSGAPAICPGCTLLVRPVFREATDARELQAASAGELAQAIVDCVDRGASLVNVSAATAMPSTRGERSLHDALDHAAANGSLVIAAAGNQGTLGSSVITRHPWVIPVVAYNRRGLPLRDSNLGGSIGRRGVGGPGEAIESLGADGTPRTGGGTSSATAFVTGAIALLWSLFPRAGAEQLRRAATNGPRRSVAPPLLDAEAVLGAMNGTVNKGQVTG